MVLIGLVGLAACAGASNTTAPTGGAPINGHWCADLAPHAFSAMRLSQAGSSITGAEIDNFNSYPNSNTSTVSGAVAGATVTLTFSNFDGRGPVTLTGPTPGVGSTAGGSLVLDDGSGHGASWYLDVGAAGSSPSGCAGSYP